MERTAAKWVVGGATAAAVVVVAWQLGALAWLTDDSHGALAACEEQTKEGLVSPSSFKLVWSDYTLRAAALPEDNVAMAAPGSSQLSVNFAAYVDKHGPELAARLARGERLSEEDRQMAELWTSADVAKKENAARLARNLPEDRTAFVSLEYDADNSFGATLREFAMCRFGPIGDDGRFERADIVQSGPVDAAAGREAKRLSGRDS